MSVDEQTVGTHRAFTSIIRTNTYGLLSGTMVIEQTDGKYVVVSAMLDGEDRALTEQLLASIKAV